MKQGDYRIVKHTTGFYYVQRLDVGRNWYFKKELKWYTLNKRGARSGKYTAEVYNYEADAREAIERFKKGNTIIEV